MFKKLLIFTLIIFFGTCAGADVDAQKSDFEFIATVNGTPISKALFDLSLQGAIAQGQKDTSQLRDSIRNELINRQLIVQEVISQGLDKEVDMQAQIAQLRQNLYLQVLVDDHFKKNPITNEMLKEEYEKQKQYLGGGTDLATQYKISQIVLKSESEAIAVIGRLKDGEPFAKVAKQLSLDAASKAQGGLLGWVSAQQVPSQIADILGTLSKGGFSQSPIKTGDVWVIVRVDDTRSTKIPSFEASQNQLRQAIVQQYLVQTVKRLRESAKVVQ
jgi:peptidyl-prolyl cis-trans isomerase C